MAGGEGFNLNLALPEKLDDAGYREALAKALRRITKFAPRTLVVALGLDPGQGRSHGILDPCGQELRGATGRMIGEMRLPTLVVQEGGYRICSLGSNAKHFFQGLAAGGLGR